MAANSHYLDEVTSGKDGHGFSMFIRGLEIDTSTSTNPLDGRFKIGNFIANGSGVFVPAATFGNVVFTGGIYANGSYGSNNQVLRTTGAGTMFWGPAPSGGGGGGGQTNVFSAIAVSGQGTLYADDAYDTLTIAAGYGMTITTDKPSDTITIRASNVLASNAYVKLFFANTNSFIKSQLANTNLAIGRLNINLLATNNNIRTLVSDRMQVANVNLIVASKISVANSKVWLANTNLAITNVRNNLLATNTALRLLISDRMQVANVNSRVNGVWTGLTGTNTAIRAIITVDKNNLQATNTALRTLISDRLQVANAAATYQTRAIERAALANTNIRINSVWSALTSTNTAIRAIITVDKNNLQATNTALRTLISDRLQVANAAVIYQTKAIERAALANTNLRINAVWTGLTGTNTAVRALINTKLAVSNAAALYTTKAYAASNAYVKSVLANTNLRINSVWTGLTGTNTAIRAIITVDKNNLQATNTAIRLLVSDRLQVANAVTIYATKVSPTTSGVFAHTGRATISTNLAVSGNTIVSKLVANNSLGSTNQVLKTNGTSVFWGDPTAGGSAASVPVVQQFTATAGQTVFTVSGGYTASQILVFLNGTLLRNGTDVTVTSGTDVVLASGADINDLVDVYGFKGLAYLSNISGVQIKSYNEFVEDLTTISSNTAINTSVANIFKLTLGASLTLSFTNPPASGVSYTITLFITQDGTGSRVITWPASVKWPNAVAPTLTTTANQTDVISLTTIDGGTKWYGGLNLGNLA